MVNVRAVYTYGKGSQSHVCVREREFRARMTELMVKKHGSSARQKHLLELLGFAPHHADRDRAMPSSARGRKKRNGWRIDAALREWQRDELQNHPP